MEFSLIKAEGENYNPVIWIIAGIHGDEYGAVKVVNKLIDYFKRTKLKKGTLCLMPVANLEAFKNCSRVIPSTKEDLNRAFPGSVNGSKAEKIAYNIFDLIIKTKPLLVIDLHNDWVNSLPYSLIEPKEANNNSSYVKSIKFARKGGFVVIQDKVFNSKWKTTLSGSLICKNIPSFTVELGGANKSENVYLGVKFVIDILSQLGMVSKQKKFIYTKTSKLYNNLLSYSEIISSKKGKLKFYVEPGESVNKNKIVAEIYNKHGKLIETLKSTHKGIVLGYTDSKIAKLNEPVIAFGVIK